MPHKLHETEHKLPVVTGFELLRPYTLEIAFDDGIRREINFDGVLEGELYGPLRDPAVFQSVKLDRESGNLVWPNGADFDPEILHDWPERRHAIIAAALQWKKYTPTRTHRFFFLLNLVQYVSIGFCAGVVAKFVMHTHSSVVTISLLSIVGSVVGGFLGHALVSLPKAKEEAQKHAISIGFTGALVGAVIILLIASGLSM